MSEYTSISLPKKFTKRIEEYIKKHPEEGYTGITDFIKEATRNHIHSKMKKLPNKAKTSC